MSENKQRFTKFIGPSYPARVGRWDSERTVNMYLEINMAQFGGNVGTGKNNEALTMIGTPGLTLLYALDDGPIRCIYTVSTTNTAYVVSGYNLYRITPNLNGTFDSLDDTQLCGTLQTNTGFVSMCDNGTSVVLVDGQYGYVTSIVNSSTTTLGTFISAGINYTTGVYTNYAVEGGNGTGMTANITVVGGAITIFTINEPGTGYQVGDILNVDSLGDTAFTTTVATAPLSVSVITSPNFYPANTVTYQDGYFIFNMAGTTNMFISALYGCNFLPLNTATKGGNSDLLQGLMCNNRELYMFGQYTTEIWYDSGASFSTPFVRQDGKFAQIGCLSAATIRRLFNTLLWIGSNPEGGGVVYMLQNDQPVRVSNHAVEYSIQSSYDIPSSTAYTWQVEGHYFYALNVPGIDTTWVYDLSTQEWFEQQSTINGVTGRHLVECHSALNGLHLVGDYTNGNLYLYDFEQYTDNGNPIVRIRQCPHLSVNLNRVFYSLMEIDFTPGVGTSNGTNNSVTPTVYLEISNDGGITFGTPLQASIGQIGAYMTRARWQRLGSSRDRVFRVSCSDPVKFDLLSCYLDFEVGTA